MNEIVEPDAVGDLLRLVAEVSPIAGLTVLLVAVRRRSASYAVVAVLTGIAGPVLFGAWRLYCHMVGYDPSSGRLGLESVRVLLISLMLFALFGAVLGAATAYLIAIKRRKV